MSTSVAVFVGTRADLGPLTPVIAALNRAKDIELHLLTGVAYGAADLAGALHLEARVHRSNTHELAVPIESLGGADVTRYGPGLSLGTANALRELRSEVLVVLGDRWELLYVVPAAFLSGVPVVHLHGGEVTEGAVDERVRHAVTKLADQHCVASGDAAARVRQLGEPPERVHLTGAPGLDRIVAAEPIGLGELSALVGRDLRRPIALFTYHPPTADEDAQVGRNAREALLATLEHVNSVIATYPGMDTGREEVIVALREVAEQDGRVTLVGSLGEAYPRALRSVDVVVGNSSSGIIEAASAGRPVVDIGSRQSGRLRGGNVIHADEGVEAVSAAVGSALRPEFVALAAHVKNPYGVGDASERIVAVVRAAVHSRRAKPFVDSRGGTA